MVDPRKREARQAQEYLSRQFRSPTTQTLTNAGNTVLELFAGSGTTLFAYENLRKDYIGFAPPKKLSIMSIALWANGLRSTTQSRVSMSPIDSRFPRRSQHSWAKGTERRSIYDRSSALSGHRKIHRRQQGPVQYFGHRCFLKKIVERNSHGFRYLRKNGYFAIVTWGYFWKKRSDSFGFQDNGFRKTTPESQVKGHRG